MEPIISVTVIVLLCGLAGVIFARFYANVVAQVSLEDTDANSNQPLLSIADAKDQYSKIRLINKAIEVGALAFLKAEYQFMAYFMVGFFFVIFVLIGATTSDWAQGVFTALAFLTGALTSIVSGYLGMRIAVFANARVAMKAREGLPAAFALSFKAGCVMGFGLTGLGVMSLYIMMCLFKLYYKQAFSSSNVDDTTRLFESVAGFGLGGSSIALFGRVGGGIFTKAADVGADQAKINYDIPEDDPRNAACIADNVGDNVGDIAGMGSDLFGSFAEATCAAMVIASQSTGLSSEWLYISFPILIPSTGILVGIVSSFFSTHIPVVFEDDIEESLKKQLYVSTILQTGVTLLLTKIMLPSDPFAVSSKVDVKWWHIFVCVMCGLWSGLVIGVVTEYWTSHRYRPVRDVAQASKTGPATNIIYGLALGYSSVIVPVFALAITVYISFYLAGMFGIAVGALGILSTMATGLAIDAFGPICDNAGGIAEMAGMEPEVRERTDALDAAGNTTAAIGKGFAIGSAALVSLALFGGFSVITGLDGAGVNCLDPFVFAGLLVGAMLPYWFSAMTMKAVGTAAKDMVEEVNRQWNTPGIQEGTVMPDYEKCVTISTEASLAMMIQPGVLVMGAPLLTGYIFGVKALAGLLNGSLISGVQLAISMSNSGGAWDNAKKFISGAACEEARLLSPKGVAPKKSDAHKAAVVGDTVGDPMKDTSGPSLNILIKLSAIVSLVFARSLMEVSHGDGVVGYFH